MQDLGGHRALLLAGLGERDDAVTDALQVKRVGQGPPWLVSLFIGGPLVASLVTSFRVNASAIRADLGWQPEHPSFAAAVGDVVKSMPSGS